MDPLAHALARLAAHQPLTADETAAALTVLMAEGVPPARAGAFLLGLRARGESASELTGAARAVRQAMVAVEVERADELVDTCGTGGGAVTTLNLSTAAAFVAAGAGARVAKHGNRSHTSRCGSADVLEALGLGPGATAAEAAAQLVADGLVFMFAPAHHPAMRHLAPVRRALGVATIMNLVGPLANPARVRRQVVGVADPDRGPVLAEALRLLGAVHALVVHARIGMDELSPLGLSDVWEVREGAVRHTVFDPAAFGLATADVAGLEGGDAMENACRLERLLDGGTNGAGRAGVVLNAGAALYVAPGGGDWRVALERAAVSLDGGAARERLARLRGRATARTSG